MSEGTFQMNAIDLVGPPGLYLSRCTLNDSDNDYSSAGRVTLRFYWNQRTDVIPHKRGLKIIHFRSVTV